MIQGHEAIAPNSSEIRTDFGRTPSELAKPTTSSQPDAPDATFPSDGPPRTTPSESDSTHPSSGEAEATLTPHPSSGEPEATTTPPASSEAEATASTPPTSSEPEATLTTPPASSEPEATLTTPPASSEPEATLTTPPGSSEPVHLHSFERVQSQFKPVLQQSNPLPADATAASGSQSTWSLAQSAPNLDPRKPANKFEQSETGKIETFKPKGKGAESLKSPQQKKAEADAEKKAKDPFERLKEKYKKAQAAAEATWGAIAGEEAKFPVTPKRRKSDDAKASMTGMVPVQPNIESAALAHAPVTEPADPDSVDMHAAATAQSIEKSSEDSFEAEPLKETSANEGVEVGSWAERVLSRKKGDTNEIALDSDDSNKPEPIRPLQVPIQRPVDTRSNAATPPEKEESWADRVIAAARKAKGTASEDRGKSAKSAPPATPKIDADQSSSMRLKFHGNAPQPALPNRLHQGSASFWSTHREKIHLACVVVGVIITGILLGRAFLSGLYAHQAEELMINKKYDAAMRYIDMALVFDPGLETAHYLKARALSRLGQDSGALVEYNIVLSTSPSRIDALERRAAVCVALGYFKQALDDCNKLAEMRSKPPTMYVYANRGVANYMLGNKNAAVKDFTTALQMKPKDMQLQLLNRRGASYRDVGETEKSLADYDAAIKINANSVDAHLGRAQSWLQAKNYNRAFADFDKALALSPRNPEILTLRGAGYATAKQYEKASDDFTEALAINPRYADAFRERARLNIMQDQLWQAEEDLGHAAQLKPPDSAFYKQRAELDRHMGNHTKAVEDYNLALQEQPYDIDSHIGRAHDYSDLGDQGAALADIDAALKIDPNIAELYALRGLYGNRYGNTSTAKNDFDKAMWLDPLNADAHLWRGEYLLKQREFMGAIEDFDKALKANPDLTEAKQKKAAALLGLKHGSVPAAPATVASLPLTSDETKLIANGSFADLIKEGNAQLTAGNANRAVALLERAVRINDTDAPARRALAHALQAAGNRNDAISQLESVLRLDQTNAGDARALGDELVRVNRMPEAIEAYKRCLQLFPDDIPATCALARAYAATGAGDKAKLVCQEGLKNAGNAAADISQINAVLKEIESKTGRH
jgi:tetratricopeptide (TPR) repeat protein